MIFAFEFTWAGLGALLAGLGSFLSGFAAYKMATRSDGKEREGGGSDHDGDAAGG